jgi:lipopolysaccharide transport system permease protein
MTTASIIIKAHERQPSIMDELRELWQYRALIGVMVRRELRVRYKDSLLGVGWSMAAPLSQVLILTFAIRYVLQAGPENMSAYILCAFLPWTFFQQSILDASTAVVTQVPLLKKVYFPREIPVIAMVCANFVHLLYALLVFVVYRWGLTTLWAGWPGLPPIQILWLPVVILIEFMLILGLSLFISAWNIFYDDIKFIVNMILNAAFYLTPIIYFAEYLLYAPALAKHPILYHLYLADPLNWVVTAFRQVFFNVAVISPPGHPKLQSAPFDWRYCLISLVISAIICVAGYRYFNAHKWKFTEKP